METFTNYLETGSTDPCYNLAFEEYVLRNRKEGSCLILWQNANAVIIGINQNTEEEINRDFVEKHGIKVVRRMTGGGAVYHDLGNLNYSFITDAGDSETITMKRFTEPVVAALRGLGLNAEASGRNDILVSGRKVSGTAQSIIDGRILHHGTLLFDSDPDMVAGALNADKEKFRSKSTKSVRSRIGNIRSFLSEDMDIGAFREYLKSFLLSGGFEEDELTDDELKKVGNLRKAKYLTWEWNFGHSPKYDIVSKKRWPGGSLEARVSVKEGLIADIKFYGDFMALKPMDAVIGLLTGCPYDPEEVRKRLKTDDIPSHFGMIDADEIIKTMFAY